MNWTGGSLTRSRPKATNSTLKLQKQYFARHRNSALSSLSGPLSHAQFPTSLVEAPSVPNIALKHSPFASLHKLEEEQRQERAATRETEGRASVGTGKRERRDVTMMADEEDVMMRRVAKRKRRELLERIGEKDTTPSRPLAATGERASSVVSGVSRVSREGESFAEKKRRLLGKRDWLGLSTLPKLRARPSRHAQQESEKDREGSAERESNGRQFSDYRSSPPRRPSQSPLARNEIPDSTVGSASLLIEVGNKRLYKDRRGNEEVESVYSDGESSVRSRSHSQVEQRQQEPREESVYSDYGQDGEYTEQDSVKEESVSDDDEYYKEPAKRPPQPDSDHRDSRYSSPHHNHVASDHREQYSSPQHDYLGSNHHKRYSSPQPEPDRQGNHHAAQRSPTADSDSQLTSFLSQLNEPSQAFESQDSVFVELCTPHTSQAQDHIPSSRSPTPAQIQKEASFQAPSEEPVFQPFSPQRNIPLQPFSPPREPPFQPEPSPAALLESPRDATFQAPKAENVIGSGNRLGAGKPRPLEHDSPFANIPDFLFPPTQPLDSLARLEASQAPSFVEPPRHMRVPSRLSPVPHHVQRDTFWDHLNVQRSQRATTPPQELPSRRNDFWEHLNANRRSELELDEAEFSMIAEPSMLAGTECDEEEGGEDEWVKFMFG
ncbi:hypothetical protein BJ508DRAFT_330775 [Ascobolus immersus RN42]|uniref:Uncharacterized protein n=1 Tax=Ascobolus immersus RN42 TaxID=1160509 RepID=A0A3N4HSG7_ASCIM|nr:hypothetical protein BJ508DRAFT_330775 [Ascobolus immersus RN42]